MLNYGKTLFNDNWKFSLCPINTEFEEAHGFKWYNVELPHDWLINDTTNLYKTGEGWYEREFDIDSHKLSDKFYICFDGVYMNSYVYVNGEEVGTWKYGYSSFYFDISKYLVQGKNKITVKAVHQSPNTRWYSGAGIFRNVFLRKAKPVHICENGVYISAKPQKDDIWKINIDTKINVDKAVVLRHTVLDKSKNEVAFLERDMLCSEDKTALFCEKPTLWSLENPYLYTMKTEILHNNEVLDTIYNTFGFRKIEFTADKGFFLNDENIKMHGVCMHHDLGALGSAMNKNALFRQLSIMKSMGVNAIRTSHNMPARELIEICDEIGLLVDTEAFDMWEIPKTEFDYARFFPEWSKIDIEAWVCRDRNHPSIVMWSIGNEIYDTHKSERGLEVAAMLKAYVEEFDYYKNAVVTHASNYMAWENAQKVADHLKIAGYNYAENLYDDHHEKHCDWVIYGSETASTVRSRGIYHFPASTPILTHDDQQCSDMGNSVVGWGKSHETAWTDDRDKDFCFGQFIWTGFDYIGEPTPYSTKNSYFGIVDTAGLPKDAYYLYKAVWTDVKTNPFVHIMPYWDWNEGQLIDVYTYSNAPITELFLNGKSLGKQEIDLLHDKKLHGEWQIPYETGTLTAKAFLADGTLVAEAEISSFTDPTKIVLKAENDTLQANGTDLAFIEISTLDKDGNPVANARNRIKVSVSQNGRLVGLDNGDSTDYDSYKGDNRKLFSGKLIAIVQSTFEGGSIKISATSEGLESATISINAVPCEKPVGVCVVNAGKFPALQTEYTNEIPVRKIQLSTNDSKQLSDKNKTAVVNAEIFPKNATYSDIGWKCVMENGIETNIADVAYENGVATITAKGDGNFRLRAYCNNGGEIPQVISEIAYSITGMGDAIRNPYKFTSACMFNMSNYALNTIERGAVGGIKSRTVIGFTGVDFGKTGTDTLVLSVGNCGGGDIPIEVWVGNPDRDGHKIDTVSFPLNGGWDHAEPFTFKLPETIKGLQTIAFVVSEHCIFGGFEFAEINRAFAKLQAADNDEMYGDEYEIVENRIENIGNNVLINFNNMDFGAGATKISITGNTPIDNNTIQIRYTSTDGGQQATQLVEFTHSEGYETREFALDKISGKVNVSFVFLPGTKFDFDSFMFME